LLFFCNTSLSLSLSLYLSLSQNPMAYCLAVMKSEGVNLIGGKHFCIQTLKPSVWTVRCLVCFINILFTVLPLIARLAFHANLLIFCSFIPNPHIFNILYGARLLRHIWYRGKKTHQLHLWLFFYLDLSLDVCSDNSLPQGSYLGFFFLQRILCRGWRLCLIERGRSWVGKTLIVSTVISI